MDTFVQAAHHISPIAASALIASVWQGLLLTAGVALALRLLRSVPAGVRTSLWTAVLVLLIVLPVLTMTVPHRMVVAHAEWHLAEDWSVALLAVWATLSVWRAVRLGLHAVRLWTLARSATPVKVDGKVASALNQGRMAELCVSAEVNRPSVAGFFRPRVLLPQGLLESLSDAELEHVVLHEMEHLRRYDDWLNLLQQISLVLLPLNPALLWLDRRLCRERELACDDGVLEATHAHRTYAACLVKLAEDSLVRKGLELALSALGTRARESELVGRVRRILAGPEMVAEPGRMRFAVGTLAAVVLFSCGLMLRTPQWISFAPVPDAVAQVAESGPGLPMPAGLRMVPAAAVKGMGQAARPVLTRAVMDSPASRLHRTTTAARRASRAVRPLHLRAGLAPVPTFGFAPALRRVSQPAMDSQPRRMVVTSFTVAQQPEFEVTWAAVPIRGGWLIVQL